MTHTSKVDVNIDEGSVLQPNAMNPVALGGTLSEHSLLSARKWLTECYQSHALCNDTSPTTTWFPTRLLYIEETESDSYHVKLIDTAKQRPSSPYATLSHRWGKGEYLQLNRHTSAVFSEAVPISELSKTFKDAITVTFRLGISYLWIDSLCIMQDRDDLSDWLHEASLMNKVYLHSHCNISASVSLDGSQGLSRQRDVANLYSPTISLLQGASDKNSEDHLETYHLINDSLYFFNVTKSPINTRGWVFQEMLLAPRVLHFSHDQLFWECRQHRTCEVDAKDNDLAGRYQSISKFKSYLQGRAATSTPYPSQAANNDLRDKAEGYEMWHDLIEEYSSKDLTNPLDKLVALSGIAKLMSTFIQGTYIAGMWRENLERDLLWFKPDAYDNGDTLTEQTKVYRAPTWSWASRDGKIRFANMEGQILFKIRDVFLSHKTQDVTGVVTNGWLQVDGELGPIRLSLPQGYKALKDYNVWKVDNVSCTHPKDEFIVIPDELSTDARHFDDDNAASRLFFMPCLLDRTNDEFSMYAMVLRVVDRNNGVFERIGMAFGLEDLGDGEIPPLPTDVDEDVKVTLPCMKYEDGKHTIRIV